MFCLNTKTNSEFNLLFSKMEKQHLRTAIALSTTLLHYFLCTESKNDLWCSKKNFLESFSANRELLLLSRLEKPLQRVRI